MKIHIILLATIFCLTTNTFSQIEFTTHIITPGAGTTDNATYVLTFDVESDGDMDIVSSSWLDNKIAWYENDGNQNFVQHIIYNNAPGASWLDAVDFDADGDTDVLSTAMVDDRIYWYENDGLGNFTPHIVFAHPNPNRNQGQWHGFSVSAYDVDSDGDMDALYGGWANPEIKWHENDGSDTTFTTHVIDTLGQRSHVIAKDLDGDGDADLLAVSQLSNTVAWYENDGDENFTKHLISNSVRSARVVVAIDLDEDGDMDVAVAPAGEKFIWFENDGNQSFTAHSIAQSPNCQSIYAVDVDNDNDLDILTATFDANMVGWLENDGNQNFAFHVITTSAWQADTVWWSDVDGDGDIDVLSAALGGDQIAWYESNLNDTPSSVENSETVPLQFSLHQNYPNPFNPSTNISYDLPHAADVRLVIYDILGREINTVVDGLKPAGQHQITVDMSGLSSGVYFYRLQTARFNEMRKMIYLR